MRTYYLLLAVLCTGLLSFSCSGNKSQSTIDKNRTEIQLSEELKSGDNPIFLKEGDALTSYFAENHIDADKRKELRIDDIKYKRLTVGDPGTEDSNEYLIDILSKAGNDNIVMSKVLDEIGTGKIVSVYLLHAHPGNPNAVNEYFISYDKDGNYVDSKVVANIMPFVAAEISYEVKNNLVRVGYDQGGESWFEFYKVMPDMTIAKVSPDGEELAE